MQRMADVGRDRDMGELRGRLLWGSGKAAKVFHTRGRRAQGHEREVGWGTGRFQWGSLGF